MQRRPVPCCDGRRWARSAKPSPGTLPSMKHLRAVATAYRGHCQFFRRKPAGGRFECSPVMPSTSTSTAPGSRRPRSADRCSISDGAILSEQDQRPRIIQRRRRTRTRRRRKEDRGLLQRVLDEATVEKLGLAPPLRLREIAAIRIDAGRAACSQLRADVDVLNNTDLDTDAVRFLVAQDLDDPSRYAPFLLQGGLGMPDRDYYLDDSPATAAIRAKYTPQLAKVLGLAGIKDADAKAGRIFELEKRMATVHSTRVESFDVVKANNHWSRKDFDTKAPGLDWQEYFKAAGLGGQSDFIVWQPAAVTGLSALVASQPLETWKEYLTARLLEHASPYLPKPFVDERFEFSARRFPARRSHAIAGSAASP